MSVGEMSDGLRLDTLAAEEAQVEHPRVGPAPGISELRVKKTVHHPLGLGRSSQGRNQAE